MNPLLRDRDVDFVLYELFDAEALCALPAFAEHGRETFDLYLGTARRLAREVLYPAYKPMDESPARLENGGIVTHARMKPIWRALVEMGVITATRPASVGGQSMPLVVGTMAHAYLMAGNLSAAGYAGLTQGAAHLIEAFGDDALKRRFMDRMYTGEWAGTMALTEPHAGSSLSDVTTRATPQDDGTFAIRGAKIFISGGDQDLTDNVVHMTLARIDGAAPGIKGVSLFAVPKMRPGEDGALVSNDVSVAGVIHKIGWRGLPSLALSFGDRGDCRGWLVGQPHKGIGYMFQMMNEARIMVGVNAAATASVAYHESLDYARNRPQGRTLASRDPSKPQVPIIEHADVKRMLLRQKAIVEGALALVAFTALQADLAEHADGPAKKRARLLLDALTPVAKSFPAEWGFESNALALQIHGGYGYSSEQLPEAWLRDQKLNTIHEGTTGIQGLDLLGRRIVAEGGAPLAIFMEEIERTAARADAAGLDPSWGAAVRSAMRELADVTAHLGRLGLEGDVESMMRHSTDYLAMTSIVLVAWLWLWQAAVAKEAKGSPFYEGKLRAAQYWITTELPRASHLAALCRSGEDSYVHMTDAAF